MIETPRLLLRPPDPAMAAGVARYQRTNREHLARWDPPRPAEVYTAAGQAKVLAQGRDDVQAGIAAAWWLFLRDAPGTPIGQLRFSQITRGAFHSAMLGYAIGRAHEGRGLMHEALGAALAEVFGPRLRLHRVQANVRPENTRSLALLDRLGFVREGLARDYLFIDGAWRHHVMTALLNPGWPAGEAPPP